MSKRRSSGLKEPIEVRCVDARRRFTEFDPVDARHKGIVGFDQTRFLTKDVTIVGAGGLGGECAEGFVRKGLGELRLFDHDTVEPSNLNRQFFGLEDIKRNKAVALAANLQSQGFMGTCIRAHAGHYQAYEEAGKTILPDLIVCAVDNDETRCYLAEYGLKMETPIIFAAVSRDANQGCVFVQEPGGPCLGCAFPDAVGNMSTPCPGVPAMKDILKLAGGLVLYVADSLLMERPRNWNYRVIHLSGYASDIMCKVPVRKGCKICADWQGE